MKHCFSRIVFLLFIFSSMAESDSLPGKLLEPEWLREHLDVPDLLLIDVRPEKDYLSGHISRAVNIPIKSTFGPDPRSDMLAPVSSIQKLFSHAGIEVGKQLVVYDDGVFIDAARLIWILEAYGHRSLALLNGGLKAWEKAGGALVPGRETVRPGLFVPAPDPKRFATRFDTRLAIGNPGRVLLDVRSEDEYLGKRTLVGRKGHIPGAVNIPWTENFQTENGITRLKPFSELKKLYEDAGVNQNKTVIAYCNKGKQSALTHFVLRELGYDVSAYDGSWFEWSQDLSLPIETPDEQP